MFCYLLTFLVCKLFVNFASFVVFQYVLKVHLSNVIWLLCLTWYMSSPILHMSSSNWAFSCFTWTSCPNKIVKFLFYLQDRLSGLGVWFALRVREVPGSNPGWALSLLFYPRFPGVPPRRRRSVWKWRWSIPRPSVTPQKRPWNNMDKSQWKSYNYPFQYWSANEPLDLVFPLFNQFELLLFPLDPLLLFLAFDPEDVSLVIL